MLSAKCRASPWFGAALALSAASCVSLVVALASPAWLASARPDSSSFVSAGLWRVCFRHYRHLDRVFDGCYAMHGPRSEELRPWLQPGWFLLVQCLVTCGALLGLLSLCLLALLLWPLAPAIELFVSVFVFVLQALSALVMFLGSCVFGAMCFERSWIQHPRFNRLSWGFAFSVLAALVLSCAAGCLLVHTFRIRKHVYRHPIAYHAPVHEP